MTQAFNVHLVSDSTGYTVREVVDGSIMQFDDNVHFVLHSWNYVLDEDKVKEVLAGLGDSPGTIIMTIMDKDIKKALESGCRELGVPCLSLMDNVLSILEEYSGHKALRISGRRRRVLNRKYFERMEAINFTMSHDDGNSLDSVYHAHIVLVGVSRTSKTPTAMYLSNRGYKVANIPYINKEFFHKDFPTFKLVDKKPLVVGLTTTVDRLIEVRRARLQQLDANAKASYVDPLEVEREMQESRKFFREMGWLIIDVTHKSIEETASLIMKHYHNLYGEMNEGSLSLV